MSGALGAAGGAAGAGGHGGGAGVLREGWVQGALGRGGCRGPWGQGILQHHKLKAPFLWHSAFLMVQLAYPYMTTGKSIALTKQTFVGKVISLLFNTLS